MIYSIYIFTRTGSCLYQEKFNTATIKAMTYSDPEEEMRLLFGLLFSLKEFVLKVSPTPAINDIPANEQVTSPSEGLQRYQTNAYTCHQYETPSGLRFVLMTDNHTGDLSAVLKHIYQHIYVEFVVNNPLSDFQTIRTITNQLFRVQLKQYIEGLACFR